MQIRDSNWMLVIRRKARPKPPGRSCFTCFISFFNIINRQTIWARRPQDTYSQTFGNLETYLSWFRPLKTENLLRHVQTTSVHHVFCIIRGLQPSEATQVWSNSKATLQRTLSFLHAGHIISAAATVTAIGSQKCVEDESLCGMVERVVLGVDVFTWSVNLRLITKTMLMVFQSWQWWRFSAITFWRLYMPSSTLANHYRHWPLQQGSIHQNHPKPHPNDLSKYYHRMYATCF